MKRRRFLNITSSAIALSPWLDQWVSAAAEKPLDIRDFLESDSPEVLALAQRVIDKCILEKLRPPVEPLLHTWVQPGGPYYNGQWIWDTMFVVDLLGILPGKNQPSRPDMRAPAGGASRRSASASPAVRSWRHLHGPCPGCDKNDLCQWSNGWNRTWGSGSRNG
jgi:hypothetical protein